MQTNGENAIWNKKTLEGQELPGGLRSLSSDAHLLGGNEQAVCPDEAIQNAL